MRETSGRAALLAGAALLLVALAHIRALWFVCDDAYISFRYAANWSAGHGLVYNPGERVEGYSNFLWTLLAALVARAGGSPERWAPVAGAACALATLALVMAAARRRGLDPVPAGVFLAASGAYAAWATGGLETALFTLLVTGGFLATASGLATGGERPAADGRRLLAGALAFGLAALVRPDGLLAGVSAGAFLMVLAARGAVPWRAWLAPAALWAACVVPHLAWRLSYYGRLLPNSAAVKAPGLELLPEGAHYLLLAFLGLHLYLLAIPIAAAIALRAGGPSRTEAGLLAAIVVPHLVYVAATGGDFMPLFRFVAPVLPLLALAAGACLAAVARRAAARYSPAAGRACVWAVLLPYAALGAHGAFRQQQAWAERGVESVGLTRRYAADWRDVGEVLARVSRPGDTLATTAAGVIPYVTGLHTLDLLGLNDPDLSRFRPRETRRAGHALLLAGRHLETLRPQFLLGDPIVVRPPRGVGLSLDLEPEWRERVLAHYVLIGLALPGRPPRAVGCMVRRDVADRVLAAAGREPASR